MAERQQFHEHMLVMVREELQEQGMKLVGALLASIGTVTVRKKQDYQKHVEVCQRNSVAFGILSARFF